MRDFHCRPSVCLCLCFLGAGAVAPALAQDGKPLYQLAGHNVFTVAEDDSAVTRRMPVEIDAVRVGAELGELPARLQRGQATRLTLPLFDGAKTVTVDSTAPTLDGLSVVADGGDVVLVWGQGLLYGSIHHQGQAYRLRSAALPGDLSANASQQVLEAVDLAVYPRAPNDGLPSSDAVPWLDDPDPVEPAAQRPTKDSGAEIDLLALYTPAARASQGGAAGIRQLIQLGVAETNTALSQSGAVPRIRLVHLAETAYGEGGDVFDHLDRLTSQTDGVMDEAHTLRDRFGADLVTLIGANTNGGCGVAWTMGPDRSPSFARLAFSYTAARCISPNYTFGHELGHNMGCLHAPVDPNNGSGAYSYSFGYKDPARAFRTIMAYDCDGSGCPRRLRWSTPNRSLGGRVLGNGIQDNTRSINGVRAVVANFRQRVQDTGTVGFRDAAVSIEEFKGVVGLSVERGGGASGTASVRWRVESGSATAGVDMADLAGTLSWANGNSASKTIEIPILADSLVEADETFRVVLSNPDGADLGQSTIDVTLVDDDVEPFICTPSDDRLCLGRNGRFEVAVTWQGADGAAGTARVVDGGTALDSALFWFFDADNWELLLKVLEGCSFNEYFWVLFAATTDVGYELRVTDSEAGSFRVYRNAAGTAAASVNDLQAFPCS